MTEAALSSSFYLAIDQAQWPRIEVVRLAIDVRWKRPNPIPGAVLGNILRGGLGLTLRKLVCPAEFLQDECHPCPLYQNCTYGQVFSPTPPFDSPQLRLQQDLPRPFIIEPPGLQSAGSPDSLSFQLTLFGRAIQSLPYFVSSLERLGHDGMGRDRVPFTLAGITARHPAGDELLFTAHSTSMSVPTRHITTEDLLAPPPPLASDPPEQSVAQIARQRIREQLGVPPRTWRLKPGDPNRPRVRVRFLTPTLLKTGSGLDASGRRIPAREVRDRPHFGILIRRLRDRLSSLCQFFGEPWHYPDFADLGRQADTVALIDSQTEWHSQTRHSTRTHQVHALAGFIGEATYEFPSRETFTALWPLLKFGELIHVGKLTPWGQGRIAASMLDAKP